METSWAAGAERLGPAHLCKRRGLPGLTPPRGRLDQRATSYHGAVTTSGNSRQSTSSGLPVEEVAEMTVTRRYLTCLAALSLIAMSACGGTKQGGGGGSAAATPATPPVVKTATASVAGQTQTILVDGD